MSGVALTLARTLARGTSSRARVLGFVGVAVVQLLVSFLVRSETGGTELDTAMTMIDGFGLTLIVPLSALVFGTAVLGDPIEDGTYVYLWLRPIRRSLITFAAFGVTLGLVAALAVVPTVLSAAITSSDGAVVSGAAAGAVAAAVAYSAIFVLIGQLTRRSLVWGIAYLLIFEQFIARGGRGVGFVSVHSHAISIMQEVSSVKLRLGYFSATTSVVVIVVVTLATLGFSVLRQNAMTVE
ncbi:MAG: hypothetical protein GX868_13690 [Actinobacteria bacterium]|nr:hypothetical protein [Actinomycetota bacterium]